MNKYMLWNKNNNWPECWGSLARNMGVEAVQITYRLHRNLGYPCLDILLELLKDKPSSWAQSRLWHSGCILIGAWYLTTSSRTPTCEEDAKRRRHARCREAGEWFARRTSIEEGCTGLGTLDLNKINKRSLDEIDPEDEDDEQLLDPILRQQHDEAMESHATNGTPGGGILALPPPPDDRWDKYAATQATITTDDGNSTARTDDPEGNDDQFAGERAIYNEALMK